MASSNASRYIFVTMSNGGYDLAHYTAPEYGTMELLIMYTRRTLKCYCTSNPVHVVPYEAR